MLLLMIERGLPIDMVLTADTGMEFPEMYRHWDRIEQYLFQKRGLKLTILRHPKGFEWLMFDEPKSKRSSLENRALLGTALRQRLAGSKSPLVYWPAQDPPAPKGSQPPQGRIPCAPLYRNCRR